MPRSHPPGSVWKQLEVDASFHTEFMRHLARFKDQLAVNVVHVSPSDFIPLPNGWQDRARSIGRFGEIEAFHFDPLSTALSKLARVYEEDLADVRTLINAGLIDAQAIDVAAEEIAAQLPDRGWSQTEIAEFRANVKAALSEGGSTG